MIFTPGSCVGTTSFLTVRETGAATPFSCRPVMVSAISYQPGSANFRLKTYTPLPALSAASRGHRLCFRRAVLNFCVLFMFGPSYHDINSRPGYRLPAQGVFDPQRQRSLLSLPQRRHFCADFNIVVMDFLDERLPLRGPAGAVLSGHVVVHPHHTAAQKQHCSGKGQTKTQLSSSLPLLQPFDCDNGTDKAFCICHARMPDAVFS